MGKPSTYTQTIKLQCVQLSYTEPVAKDDD